MPFTPASFTAEEHMAETKSLGAGLIAGAIGGLVASWVMNVFMEQAGPKIQQVTQKVDDSASNQQASSQSESSDKEPKEDATMKAADAVFSTITGGRHLSMEGKQKGGPIVHYAFGALMGAIYGVGAEYSSMVSAGFGTAFAGALFAGADLWAVPTLHLSGSSEASVSSLATPFSAHIVYGVTTEAVRRTVRAMI
jgi:putative membrane protein